MATAESAAAVAATTTAAAIKTMAAPYILFCKIKVNLAMAANAPTDPQTLLGIRGIAPTVTASSVYLRPGRSGEDLLTYLKERRGKGT